MLAARSMVTVTFLHSPVQSQIFQLMTSHPSSQMMQACRICTPEPPTLTCSATWLAAATYMSLRQSLDTEYCLTSASTARMAVLAAAST